MRLLDHDEPIDPEIAASLDAIDAVLAGEPVGAEYAELAEIALLLTAERPQARQIEPDPDVREELPVEIFDRQDQGRLRARDRARE